LNAKWTRGEALDILTQCKALEISCKALREQAMRSLKLSNTDNIFPILDADEHLGRHLEAKDL